MRPGGSDLVFKNCVDGWNPTGTEPLGSGAEACRRAGLAQDPGQPVAGGHSMQDGSQDSLRKFDLSLPSLLEIPALFISPNVF